MPRRKRNRPLEGGSIDWGGEGGGGGVGGGEEEEDSGGGEGETGLFKSFTAPARSKVPTAPSLILAPE